MLESNHLTKNIVEPNPKKYMFCPSWSLGNCWRPKTVSEVIYNIPKYTYQKGFKQGLKTLMKPWITNGTLVSIRNKNKTHRELHWTRVTKQQNFLIYMWDWLYFFQCLTSFSSIDHTLHVYTQLLMLLHLI